jgi:SAM-dependent methyltransferase
VTQADQYADGTHVMWLCSGPTPELVDAIADGVVPEDGIVADLGCGIGNDISYLASHGRSVVGVELSETALRLARQRHPRLPVLLGDVRRLPLASGGVAMLLDRGCFHYQDVAGMRQYAAEAARVLRLGGRLLLRACLPHGDAPAPVSEDLLLEVFAGWAVERMERQSLAVDRGTLDAIVTLLTPTPA